MAEEKQPEKETAPLTPPTQPQPQPQTQSPQPQPAPQQGMSSGAKWGIGLGACFCCLILVFIIIAILGFAGCTFVRSFGGYNWPASPPFNEGTEIPIPSFSSIPQ